MNTNADSPPEDVLDLIIEMTRIEFVFSPRRRRSEQHAMPKDHPPIPHVCDASCWCEPELVYNDGRKSIYRHKRQQ